MAITHGTPFEQSRWFTRRGIGGLPLEDDNHFYYLGASGEKVDALPYAQGFFKLIETFATELTKRPWV